MKSINLNIDESYCSKIIINSTLEQNHGCILKDYSTNTDFIILTTQNILVHHKQILDSFFHNYKYNIIITVEGEAAKTIGNAEKIYSELLKIDCKKDTCLVAFGGGVIGDLTGFIASTFMRGIHYINIPTSLLAMVDSSIGGKTGVNLTHGKNLIGTIYHPSKIIIYPELLQTLPQREYNAGMIEIIKYALIMDSNLFNYIKNNLNQLLKNSDYGLIKEVIIKCIKHKIDIVKQDHKDLGLRNILNFGHTIGHAIEACHSYKDINHGEAVAYGILFASKISNIYSTLSDDEYNDIKNLINKITLPKLDKLNIDKILNFIINDKKNTREGLRFILLNNIGKAEITTKIDNSKIEEVIAEYEYISH